MHDVISPPINEYVPVGCPLEMGELAESKFFEIF
jgi:hypothetical protein